MSFSFNISSSIEEFIQDIDDRQRSQVPFVTAFALTKTAQEIQREEIEVMRRVFDRPTRFTLNSLYVEPARKDSLVAAVRFKEGFGSVPAWRYLGPQVQGGGRVKKSFERALERAGILRGDEFVVPGQGVPLDAYGNVSGGLITRILSQLAASPDPMQNMTQRSAKRARRKKVGRYFVLRGTRAPDGIYWRRNARDAVPVLMFVRAPRYAPRFPFYETAEAVLRTRFAANFRIGWQRYVLSRPQRRAA